MAEPVAITATDGTQAEVVIAWFLNVRAGAGIEFNPVGVIARGDVVDVLDSRFGWVHISTNGLQGWSYSGYLEMIG